MQCVKPVILLALEALARPDNLIYHVGPHLGPVFVLESGEDDYNTVFSHAHAYTRSFLLLLFFSFLFFFCKRTNRNSTSNQLFELIVTILVLFKFCIASRFNVFIPSTA